MTAPTHLVILASAGTGKTYRLTSHYLSLLLSGEDVSRILAITFTRKAAGEIAQRLMTRLVKASRDARAREALAESVGRVALTPQHVDDALDRLLRSMDELRISTIDAFFTRVAGSAGLALGLAGGWRTAEPFEHEALVRTALNDCLERMPRDEVVSMVRALHASRFSFTIYDRIVGAVEQAHEVYDEAPDDAWSSLLAPPGPPREVLARAMDGLARMGVPTNKNGSPNKRWTRPLDDLRAAAEAGDWEALATMTLVTAATAPNPDDRRYSGIPLQTEHLSVLVPLFEHARHEIFSRWCDGNRAMHALVARFDEAVSRLKQDSGVFEFADLPRLVIRAMERAGEQVIYETADGSLSHLLLDEFQDTSMVQWSILEPLAREFTADGTGMRSFFCVGDGKQSLYGWRNAEPALLPSLSDRLGVETERLSESFRSSPPVISAVNEVFEGIEQNAVFVRDSCGTAAAKAWRALFDLHTPVHKDMPGFARLRVAGGEPGEDGPRSAAIERVSELVADDPGASVGVLVRRKVEGARIIARLRRAGIEASDEGGNPLTDSTPVSVALSMLHLVEHPDDSAAAFHVGSSPLGAVVGLKPREETEGRRATAREVGRRIAVAGLGAEIGAWWSALRGELDGRDDERFGQLVEQAIAWARHPGGGVREFVRRIHVQCVERATPARVRVMTVHASKGLDFDHVILPDLDSRLVGDAPGVLTGRAGPLDPIDAVGRRLRKKLRALNPQLERMHEQWKQGVLHESLSVLYVAMTRAKRTLDMIVQHAPKEKRTTSADVLLAALAPRAARDPGATLWQAGDVGGIPPGSENDRAAVTVRPMHVPVCQLCETGAAFPVPSLCARLERLRGREALEFGREAHARLERLEWVETQPSAERQILSDPAFGAALASPSWREALSRETWTRRWGGAEMTLWREVEFALPEQSPQRPGLRRGRFDRLIVGREGGQVTRACIQDFKTDAGGGASIPDEYLEQLARYRDAVSVIFSMPPDRIITQLLWVADGTVTEDPDVGYG